MQEQKMQHGFIIFLLVLSIALVVAVLGLLAYDLVADEPATEQEVFEQEIDDAEEQVREDIKDETLFSLAGPLELTISDDFTTQYTTSLLGDWLEETYGVRMNSLTDFLLPVGSDLGLAPITALSEELDNMYIACHEESTVPMNIVEENYDIATAMTNPASLKREIAYTYHITPNNWEATQTPHSFSITAIPNHTGIKTMDEFMRYFNVCEAGASAYPYEVHEDWLVFRTSCGSGYADDTELPVGCAEAESALTDITVK